MDLNDLTIIVPTRNESRNIAQLINSIPEQVHLILADYSEDDTARIACQLRHGRTLVYECNEHIAASRHLGAQLAHTPWLLFTDADVHFAPDYFNRLQTLPEADAYYGAKLSQDEFIAYYQKITRWQNISQSLAVPAVSGSNFIVRRKAYFASGGFDLDLLVNEDSELGWRLARKGFNVKFDPELVVYAHDHRRLYRGTFQKTLHSLIRCGLLYLNLMPRRWRKRDWGYWTA